MLTSIPICLIFRNFVTAISHTLAVGRPLLLWHCFLRCYLIIGWLVIGMDSTKRQKVIALSAHGFATRVAMNVRLFAKLNCCQLHLLFWLFLVKRSEHIARSVHIEVAKNIIFIAYISLLFVLFRGDTCSCLPHLRQWLKILDGTGNV